MKKLLPLLIILIGFSLNAQVGIGTDMPNSSSQLEIVANDRGLLIPQVPLTSSTDETTISNGNVESLLVFNTSNSGDLTPGYYYWFNGSWKRIGSSSNPDIDIPENIVIWNPQEEAFFYLDEDGEQVSIGLDDIANESITTLVDNVDGTYTYTSEDNSVTTINVPADVVGNISNNGIIYEEIIGLLDGRSSSFIDNGDGTFTHISGDGNEVTFDANTSNFSEDENGNYIFVNTNGDRVTINPVDDVVENISNQGDIYNEFISLIEAESDILVDNGDGTFTHTSSDGTVVTFDANTTSVSEVDEVYTFTDGNGNTIATIDTNADALNYDNTNSGLAAGNVQDALDELVSNLNDMGLDNIDLSDNGDGTFTYIDAQGNTIDFDANTTSYSKDGLGNYTFTNDNGETITVTVVDDVVANIQNKGAIYNEIIDILGTESDVLVDNGDGTYTHTSVDGTEELIDANTTSVSEADGVYTFTDGNGDTIITIDTNADAIVFDNSTNGFASDNVQAALEELLTELETGFGNLTIEDNVDGSFSLVGSDGITILGTVEKSDLTDNTDGSYTFTNNDGDNVEFDVLSVDISYDDVAGEYNFLDSAGNTIATIDTNANALNYDNTNSGLASDNVQDALDEIQSNLDATTDELEDNGDGTFTHTAVDGTVVTFDANTTSVMENADGSYTFTDGSGNPITTVETAASTNEYDNTNSGLASDNVQDALDEIQDNLDNTTDELIDNNDGTFTHTAVDGTVVTFDANTTSVMENADGSYTFTDGSGNPITTVETAASTNEYDNTNSGLASDNVQDALDEIQDNLDNTTDELIDNNDGTFTHTTVDGTVVTFDANTTSVTENADGSYTFTDGSGNPITTVETAASTNEYDNTNSGLASDNVQDALDEIQDNLDNTTDELIDNNDGTFTHTTVDGTVVTFDANTTSVMENADGSYTFTDGSGNPITTVETAASTNEYDNTNSGLASDNVQDALDEIQDNLDNTTDELIDNNDGTFTHTTVDGTVVTFDANTTSVMENADGSYTFTDGSGNPITTVETAASTNEYDNTNSGLASDNVQDALDEIQDNLDNTTDELIDNNDGTFTHTAVDGTVVTFDANTTSVMENADGSYTFTDGSGNPITTVETAASTNEYDNTNSGLASDNVQDALDEIQDNLDNTTDELIDNNDGTFTHTTVDGTVVTFDANTTSVTENADGSYTFTDGAGNPITTVETAASTNEYDNTNSGLASDNVQDALDEVVNSMNNGAGVSLVDNNDGTVTLTSDNGDDLGTITKTQVSDNQDGTYTFDTGNGTPVTVDTNANAIAYDNSTSGLSSDNTQGAIDELSQTIENNKGDLIVSEGIEFTTGDGVDKLLADAGIRIADEGIIQEKIADNAVTNSKINDGAVTSAKIRNGDVDEVDLSDDAVSTDKIQNGAVTNQKVRNDAITTDKIADGEVQTDDIANQNITPEKLVADPGDDGKVGVVQPDGSVVYENVSSSNVDGQDLTAGDASITVVDGTGATLVDANVSVAADGITNDKLADDAVETENIVDGTVETADLADGSVTNDKVGTDAITTDKIANGEVQAEDLGADPADDGKVGVVQNDGSIVYQNVDASTVDGNDFTSNDLTITGGTGATLTAVTAEISDGAVDTDALGADAVTNEKLADDAVNTENILDGAVGTADLADNVITTDKIANGEVQAEDLGADPADDGKVGVVQPDGTVVYQNLSSESVDGEDLSVSDGIEFTGGTDGVGKLLAETGIGIADDGITTDKLAADAVTNEKLADDAVNTENILDGAVGTADLADNAITTDKIANGEVQAEDLGADPADDGKVGVVQNDGSIVYQNVDASTVDGNDFTSNDLTITGGTGATLTAVTAEISDGAVDTDALGADAVTNEKLADDAVNTENIVDGTVEASDINPNVAGDGLIQNSTTGALEVGANNGLTATIDNIQLGGDLIQPTTITADATNTLAIEGLEGGSKTDNIVVIDPNSGVIKQMKAAMPKFFYMPSVVFDTSSQGTFTRNLHQEYVDQFGSPVVSSSGASGAIPTLNANDLEYYITYYDDTVFDNLAIDANGNLTYDVISSTNSVASFMNIVFVVK